MLIWNVTFDYHPDDHTFSICIVVVGDSLLRCDDSFPAFAFGVVDFVLRTRSLLRSHVHARCGGDFTLPRSPFTRLVVTVVEFLHSAPFTTVFTVLPTVMICLRSTPDCHTRLHSYGAYTRYRPHRSRPPPHLRVPDLPPHYLWVICARTLPFIPLPAHASVTLPHITSALHTFLAEHHDLPDGNLFPHVVTRYRPFTPPPLHTYCCRNYYTGSPLRLPFYDSLFVLRLRCLLLLISFVLIYYYRCCYVGVTICCYHLFDSHLRFVVVTIR